MICIMGELKCSKCGAVTERGQFFCRKCGQKLDINNDVNESNYTIRDAHIKTKKTKISKKIIVVAIILLAVIIATPVTIMIAIKNNGDNKCGDNLKWRFDDTTRTLTITGTGPMYSDWRPVTQDTDPERKRPWDRNKLYEKVEKIVIEDGCTYIGKEAFFDFKELNSVSIPNSVKGIGDLSFARCDSLANIDLPNGLETIDGSPFGYDQIKYIVLPNSIVSTGAVGSGVHEIRVNIDNPKYTAVDGILFNKEKTILVSYPSNKENDNYDIPDSVYVIGDYAFCDANYLKSVSIPDNVQEIGDYCFAGAFNIEKIHLPETVKKIGEGAFSHCEGLKDINLPSSITSLPEEVFFCCGFREFNVPSHISEISTRAFCDCNKLESVNVQDGVKKIGDEAFSSCYNLSNISIPQSVSAVGEKAFEYCKDDTVINYLGTKNQWLSFASDIRFKGIVRCSDGEYRYDNNKRQ